MMGFINVDTTNYMPVNGFTTVDLGCERGNNAYSVVQKSEAPMSQHFLTLFDQLWNDNNRMQVVTEEVLDNITNAYKENAPDFLYFVTLYNIFKEFLEDISEDVLPNEATGFKDSVIWNYWCPVKLFCVPKIKVGFLARNPTFFVTFVFVTKPK